MSSQMTNSKGASSRVACNLDGKAMFVRFTEWRKRDIETGKGEMDVVAASDSFVYSK